MTISFEDVPSVQLHEGPVLTLDELFAQDTKFETRLEAAERESKSRSQKIEAAMVEADAKGELWTVQAALRPGRVFCMVYHGHYDDTEALSSQHQDAWAILGPHHLMGNQKEVMAETLKLFTVNEITIRVIK